MKPDLYLLCGLLCDDACWRDVAGLLDDAASVRILSFPNMDSIEAMADRVLATAPAHFALAGHSMGGRVALEVMRRAPERGTALALLNTGVHPRAAHEPESRGRLVRLAREQGMTALANEWLPPMLNANAPPAPELVANLTAMVERSTPESFAMQITALLNRPDAEKALASVRAPTLLLSATGDRWSPPQQHEAMRQVLPHATLTIVRDAGHMAPVEQPQAVADVLRTWLGAISPAPG